MEALTNKYNQSRLNKKKWLESEKQIRDMSGEMFYCSHCEFQDGVYCKVNDPERTTNCYCAKAYNRLKRMKKGK